MAGAAMTIALDDRSEHGGGAVSAPMAALLVVLLAVVGLAVDGVRAAQGVARADAIAEEAARAAGQALDPVALQGGRIALDTNSAVRAAQEYLAAAGVQGSVAVSAPQRVEVTVRISRPTVLLGLLGRPEIVSTGTAEAQLVPVIPDGGGG
jgi:Flp pilus assembly protein TadG